MPLDDAGTRWANAKLSEYMREHEAAIEAASAPLGGITSYHLDLAEFIGDSGDPQIAVERTFFFLDRLLAHESIALPDAQEAWDLRAQPDR